MSASIVQSNHNQSTTGNATETITLGSATTAGSTIVIAECITAGFVAQPTPTGPAGFTHLTQAWQANQASVDVWYLDNDAGGHTSWSVTGLPNNVQHFWYIYELKNTVNTGSKDKDVQAVGNSGSLTASTGTLTQADEIVFAFLASAHASSNITADGSAATSVAQNTVNGSSLAEEKSVGATTSVTLTGSTTSAKWAETIVSFKSSAADFSRTLAVTSSQALSNGKAVSTIKKVSGTGTASLKRKYNKAVQLVTNTGTVVFRTSRTLLKSLVASSAGTASLATFLTYTALLAIAGTGAVAVLKAMAKLQTVAHGGSVRVVKSVRKPWLIAGTGSAALSAVETILQLLSVVGTSSVFLSRTVGKRLVVALSGVTNILKSVAKTIHISNAGSVFIAAVKSTVSVLIVAASAGVAIVSPSLSIFQSIVVVGTHAVHLALVRAQIIGVIGTQLIRRTRSIHKRLVLHSPAPKLIFDPRQFRLLKVVGSGAAQLAYLRLRLIRVVSTHAISLARQRAMIMAVLGHSVAGLHVTVLKRLYVAGNGIAVAGVTLLRTLTVVGTGLARLTHSYIVRLRVVGTHAVTFGLVRAMALVVAGTSLASLYAVRGFKQLLKVVSRQRVVVRRLSQKLLFVSSGGVVYLRIPRLIQVAIAVTGSKLLSLVHRKGTPSLAHPTRYNITVSDDTQFNIQNDL